MNRGEVLTACFRDKQSQRSIRMEFVIIMILFDVMTIARYTSFDIVQSAFGESINMTVRGFFAYVYQLMFSVLKARMDTYRI